MSGVIALSNIQTNHIITAFIDKKITKMTKRTAADAEKVQWQNRQRSLRQEGCGFVPADFQANIFHIITPQQVFMKG